LINDDSPDYISFGFSSLQRILSAYGEESAKFKAALFAVDAVVNHAKSVFNKLYSQSVHSHCLFVSPDKISFSNSVKSVVSDCLSSSILNPSSVVLPSIYLRKDVSLSDSCSQLKNKLSSEDVDVFCPSLQMDSSLKHFDSDPLTEDFRAYEFVDVVIGASSNSTITYDDVVVFQLMFWFTITMIIVLVCSACAVFAVDIPRHANLIRQLPNLFHESGNQKNLW